MDQKLTPFISGWKFPGLGPYRFCEATYCFYPYESLPSIPVSLFRGTLDWLTPLDGYADISGMDHYHSADDLRQVIADAHILGISLPGAFLQLMSSSELMERIPSCTDAYFSLSDVVPCPGSESGYIVRFMNARQGQIAWYLYLTPQGEHCVLVGFPLLDLLHNSESAEYKREGITEEERAMAFAGKGACVCASSFEEFIYRFWIENTLWYKVSGYSKWKPLTEEEKQYIAHYTRDK